MNELEEMQNDMVSVLVEGQIPGVIDPGTDRFPSLLKQERRRWVGILRGKIGEGRWPKIACKAVSKAKMNDLRARLIAEYPEPVDVLVAVTVSCPSLGDMRKPYAFDAVSGALCDLGWYYSATNARFVYSVSAAYPKESAAPAWAVGIRVDDIRPALEPDKEQLLDEMAKAVEGINAVYARVAEHLEGMSNGQVQ